MKKFEAFSSVVVPLLANDVDTDQIIPARFLTTTAKEGLGRHLFQDWRFDRNGNPKPDFVLNRPEDDGAQILLVGENFGCGSSREHAPWALVDAGIRAILGLSFANIFSGNAFKNGLLPVALEREDHATILGLLEADPAARLSVDLAPQAVILPDGRRIAFPIDAFAKRCLLDGVDELGYILGMEGRIEEYERQH